MQLTQVQINNFQSIQDSNIFQIGDVTCLVGKNEAGKTALLKALYRLNPIIDTEGDFDPVEDYPRGQFTDYEEEVEAGHRSHANVVQATYRLDTADIEAVADAFGADCLADTQPFVTLHKGYANKLTFCDLRVNSKAAVQHLLEAAGLSDLYEENLLERVAERTLANLVTPEQAEAARELEPTLPEIAEHGVPYVIYKDILAPRLPKFLYFDEYYQLKGQENIEALQQRVMTKTLEGPDQPLLGLIELAGLTLERLIAPKRTEALLARLEAAEIRLTRKVLTYWSQNRHLQMRFDIRPAQAEDPPGMTTGTNILGRLQNLKHMVSTSLGSRSRGFIWFFSFLALYSQFQRKGENIILLLDEPGLSLHGKAQEDLLKYFDKEITPHHQLIYTTHSPFMVDPLRFDRVRIVQDLSQERDDIPEDQEGTKVITEVLDATPDSLFPLQGALGNEIYQTLFIGPNCLVVEGVSDLLYIQTMSALLQKHGRAGLDTAWTITPVGGAGNVTTFVALIGAQTNLKVAVLIDYQKKDQQSIENLYKRRLLHKTHVFTYADFVAEGEADIEDMFNPSFYLQLVEGEFGASIPEDRLPERPTRILKRLEQYWETTPLPNGAHFNHYRPARYFNENISSLADQLGEEAVDRFQQAFDQLNQLL